MYLKSLKLVGFKSFADRTHLEFRQGVTVVVGPNGSGKSNIVDALSWVLGTQSTTTLRTSKMEDVVFAGTASRPSLGRAEVSIVLDNSDRSLALDLDEVAITRRLYRDGSRDYELNGVSCRLLDITELFSDSGVGRHQHVIVGQGRIERILNAGADEHRGVVEEAAGVLKHRQRMERAIRRLERTDVDLNRLQDLLGEIKRQMRPLKRQAKAAERHGGLRAEIRSLRLYLGGEGLRSIDGRLLAIESEESRLAQVLAGTEEQLRVDRVRHDELNQAAGEVGRALERDSSAAARLETTIERLRTTASVAHERTRAGRERLEGAEARRRDLVEERDAIEIDLTDIDGEIEGVAPRVDTDERRFRDVEAEERSLLDQSSLTPEGALAVVRGEVRSLENAQDRDDHELESVEGRRSAIEGRGDDASERLSGLESEIHQLDAQAVAASDQHDRIRMMREETQERRDRAEEAHRAAETARERTDARLEAITTAMDGTADETSRDLVAGAEGVRGSLTSLLDIPPDLAGAVDSALAPWVDGLVFTDEEALTSAVAALKTSGGGGVPLVTGARHTPDAGAIAGELGADLLVDLLGANADLDLARSLLGDVVLVEGWTTAHRIVSVHPEVRAVTPEGDLVVHGAIHVAHPDGVTPAMVETAALALEESELEVARATSRLTPVEREFHRVRDEERVALEALEGLEAKLTVATEELGRVRRSMTSLEEEKTRLTARVDALKAAMNERTVRLDGLGDRLAALEGEEADRQRIIAEIDRQREEVSARREEARVTWQTSQGELRAARERRQLYFQRLTEIASEIRRHDEHPVDAADLSQLGAIEEWARRASEVAARRLEELRTRQSELRAAGGETTQELERVATAIETNRDQVDAARQQLSRFEVERTELEVRREGVAEGLRRDADADEKQALSAPMPEIDEEPEEFPSVLESREAELRRMGPVNPLAAEEYAELEERHDHIADQLADLQGSRAEVRKVIEALDIEIQERFLSAFEEIAAAYERNFSILFPGGKGRMRLTDPSEPLTSGIEIAAQPLGKKVAKLSLLSGGERSMAALAFLFSVFEARPSPFYILDEVEAALDDANLRRFLRLLESFRSDSQLVIITHQQQTMEAADVLYGVTMEPGGSSSVLRKEVTAATSGGL
ncbi:MAG: chromosome segregation protein SMC [Acidimicrobiia bacterium]|nr:chromosome segregation protein SMC [Acidimicrobiia bacterium]